MQWPRSCALLLGITLLAACTDSPSSTPNITRIDSAGVAIVRIERLEELPFPTWRSQLVYSTASLDSVLVGVLAQAVFTPDSSLVLGDGADLMLLAPDGGLARILGRRGLGPGEFQVINRVKLVGNDAIAVADLNGRITVMTPGGEVLRTIPRLDVGADDRELDVVTALADGRFLSTFWQSRPNRGHITGIPVGSLERDAMPLVLHAPTGERGEVLGQWLGLERAVVPLYADTARLPVPFARGVAYASRKDVTVIGPTDSLDLSVFEGTRMVERWIAPPSGLSPTRQQNQAWRQAVLGWDRLSGADIVGALSGVSTNRPMPSFGAVQVDDSRNIWIGSHVAPGVTRRAWRVISPAGIPLGMVELPAVSDTLVPRKSELLDVYGDLVAVLVVRDGVPVVEVLRVLP